MDSKGSTLFLISFCKFSQNIVCERHFTTVKNLLNKRKVVEVQYSRNNYTSI